VPDIRLAPTFHGARARVGFGLGQLPKGKTHSLPIPGATEINYDSRTMKSTPSSITHDEIALRAHAIWEQSGRPDGQETEHWLRAERELRLERGQAEEFEKCDEGPGNFSEDRFTSALRV
jgi:hypothetical protein